MLNSLSCWRWSLNTPTVTRISSFVSSSTAARQDLTSSIQPNWGGITRRPSKARASMRPMGDSLSLNTAQVCMKLQQHVTIEWLTYFSGSHSRHLTRPYAVRDRGGDCCTLPCRKSHRVDGSKKVVKFTDISEGGLPEKALKGQSISYHTKCINHCRSPFRLYDQH